MEKSYREVLSIKASLNSLGEYRLPVKPALAVAKVVKTVEDVLVEFGVVRDDILKRYKVKRTQVGDMVSMAPEDPEKVEEFNATWNELLDVMVEVKIDTIKLPEKVASTCDKCNHNMDKPLEIAPNILSNLLDFIEL